MAPVGPQDSWPVTGQCWLHLFVPPCRDLWTLVGSSNPTLSQAEQFQLSKLLLQAELQARGHYDGLLLGSPQYAQLLPALNPAHKQGFPSTEQRTGSPLFTGNALLSAAQKTLSLLCPRALHCLTSHSPGPQSLSAKLFPAECNQSLLLLPMFRHSAFGKSLMGHSHHSTPSW